MTTPPLDDLAQLADAAMEQFSRREVVWVCPYCGTQVPDERTPHCGEVHAEPTTEGED